MTLSAAGRIQSHCVLVLRHTACGWLAGAIQQWQLAERETLDPVIEDHHGRHAGRPIATHGRQAEGPPHYPSCVIGNDRPVPPIRIPTREGEAKVGNKFR